MAKGAKKVELCLSMHETPNGPINNMQTNSSEQHPYLISPQRNAIIYLQGVQNTTVIH